jgi:hypothetical protein
MIKEEIKLMMYNKKFLIENWFNDINVVIYKMDNIDEYACLQEWSKIKIGDLTTLQLCDERYNRYLRKISYWMDEEGNDYSYIRDKVIRFVSIHNQYSSFDYKFNLMKEIDGDIMFMMSMCLMKDMNI